MKGASPTLFSRLFGGFRKVPLEEQKRRLHTLVRYEDGDVMEYRVTVQEVQYKDLPREAVHRSGSRDDAWLIDMEPRYPAYSSENVPRDRDGNPTKPFNEFDANGYFTYAIDERLKKAEQAVATLNLKRELEWQKIITIVAVGAVVALVVWKFLS